jgi:hypothetical protein
LTEDENATYEWIGEDIRLVIANMNLVYLSIPKDKLDNRLAQYTS